ncbi:MAG: hypothetical protein LBL45_01105, partial [Treponema sp.]|nr:hypothetical protein [Treponema sp.]
MRGVAAYSQCNAARPRTGRRLFCMMYEGEHAAVGILSIKKFIRNSKNDRKLIRILLIFCKN